MANAMAKRVFILGMLDRSRCVIDMNRLSGEKASTCGSRLGRGQFDSVNRSHDMTGVAKGTVLSYWPISGPHAAGINGDPWSDRNFLCLNNLHLLR